MNFLIGAPVDQANKNITTILIVKQKTPKFSVNLEYFWHTAINFGCLILSRYKFLWYYHEKGLKNLIKFKLLGHWISKGTIFKPPWSSEKTIIVYTQIFKTQVFPIPSWKSCFFFYFSHPKSFLRTQLEPLEWFQNLKL